MRLTIMILLVSLAVVGCASTAGTDTEAEASEAMEAAEETTTTEVATTEPATTTTTEAETTTTTETLPGSPEVHAAIAASTDCAELQETFDRASNNFDKALAEGDAAERDWTVAYMKASDERLQEVGCYDE